MDDQAKSEKEFSAFLVQIKMNNRIIRWVRQKPEINMDKLLKPEIKQRQICWQRNDSVDSESEECEAEGDQIEALED